MLRGSPFCFSVPGPEFAISGEDNALALFELTNEVHGDHCAWAPLVTKGEADYLCFDHVIVLLYLSSNTSKEDGGQKHHDRNVVGGVRLGGRGSPSPPWFHAFLFPMVVA